MNNDKFTPDERAYLDQFQQEVNSIGILEMVESDDGTGYWLRPGPWAREYAQRHGVDLDTAVQQLGELFAAGWTLEKMRRQYTRAGGLN